MSYNIASLTPSRPAPPVPGGGSRSAAPPHPSGSQGSSQANPNFSSSSYASSFPILNPASALNPGAHSHEGRKTVIRTGHASVKEEGLRSFLWSKRWLVLGGTDLQIFKNEVSHSEQCFWRCADMSLFLDPTISHYPYSHQIAIILPCLHLQLGRCRRCSTSRPQTLLRGAGNEGEIDILCIPDGRGGIRVDGGYLFSKSIDGRFATYQLCSSGPCWI